MGAREAKDLNKYVETMAEKYKKQSPVLVLNSAKFQESIARGLV